MKKAMQFVGAIGMFISLVCCVFAPQFAGVALASCVIGICGYVI